MLEDDYIVRQLRALVKAIVNRFDQNVELKQEAIKKKANGDTRLALNMFEEAIENSIGLSPANFDSLPVWILARMIGDNNNSQDLLLAADLFLEKAGTHRIDAEKAKANKAFSLADQIIERLAAGTLGQSYKETLKDIKKKSSDYKKMR